MSWTEGFFSIESSGSVTVTGNSLVDTTVSANSIQFHLCHYDKGKSSHPLSQYLLHELTKKKKKKKKKEGGGLAECRYNIAIVKPHLDQ